MIKKKVVQVINDVNPKLKRLVGAKVDLIKVDDKKAEVFIKIKTERVC